MSSIIWPEKYTPGTTDNYVSNEVVVPGLTAEKVWPFLADPSKWETYYWNCSHVTPPHEDGILLKENDKFSFSTFGIGPFPLQCLEAVPPTPHAPARIAWRGWMEKADGSGELVLDVYHAWLLEDLEGGRLRILTQESQIGTVARDLASKRPNPMLNGHQDWVDGLVSAARGKPDLSIRSLP